MTNQMSLTVISKNKRESKSREINVNGHHEVNMNNQIVNIQKVIGVNIQTQKEQIGKNPRNG